MGVSCSRGSTEEDEYNIPPMEQWRHVKSTVRARHQLSILLNRHTVIIAELWRNSKKDILQVRQMQVEFPLQSKKKSLLFMALR